jgi:hypothetical protein
MADFDVVWCIFGLFWLILAYFGVFWCILAE